MSRREFSEREIFLWNLSGGKCPSRKFFWSEMIVEPPGMICPCGGVVQREIVRGEMSMGDFTLIRPLSCSFKSLLKYYRMVVLKASK